MHSFREKILCFAVLATPSFRTQIGANFLKTRVDFSLSDRRCYARLWPTAAAFLFAQFHGTAETAGLVSTCDLLAVCALSLLPSPMPRPRKPCIHRPHGHWCTGPTGAIIVHVGSSHGFVPDAGDAPAVGRNLSYCTRRQQVRCSSRPLSRCSVDRGLPACFGGGREMK